ncbi:MAG: hypothetical protein RL659_2039 [Pseudomonadota bacterium]
MTDEFNPLSRDKSALNLNQVSWVLRNSARHHQWRLDATPPTGWGAPFTFMGDVRRGLLSTHPGRVKDWSGQLHAEFSDVNLSQLGPHLPWNVNATQGQGALRMWLDLNHGNIQQATADLVLENAKAQLSPELEGLSFKSIAGRMSFKPMAHGFDFSTEGLRFDTADGLHWPGGNISLSYSEADKTLHSNYLCQNPLGKPCWPTKSVVWSTRCTSSGLKKTQAKTKHTKSKRPMAALITSILKVANQALLPKIGQALRMPTSVLT